MGSNLGGNKFDQGKAQLSMLPRVALEQEAKVMEFGANKYGKFNYKKGMKWSRLLDAALRHVIAFSSGENHDPETGYSHLAHARCCLGFLLEYADQNLGEDDRLPKDEKKIPDLIYYDPNAAGRYTVGGFPDLSDPTWANQSKLASTEPAYYQCNPGCDADCQDCEVGDASGYSGESCPISAAELLNPTSGKLAAKSKASGSPIEGAARITDVNYSSGGGTGYGEDPLGPKGTGYFRIRRS